MGLRICITFCSSALIVFLKSPLCLFLVVSEKVREIKLLFNLAKNINQFEILFDIDLSSKFKHHVRVLSTKKSFISAYLEKHKWTLFLQRFQLPFLFIRLLLYQKACRVYARYIYIYIYTYIFIYIYIYLYIYIFHLKHKCENYKITTTVVSKKPLYLPHCLYHKMFSNWI